MASCSKAGNSGNGHLLEPLHKSLLEASKILRLVRETFGNDDSWLLSTPRKVNLCKCAMEVGMHCSRLLLSKSTLKLKHDEIAMGKTFSWQCESNRDVKWDALKSCDMRSCGDRAMFRKSMDVELIGVGFVSLVSFISIEYHRSRYTPCYSKYPISTTRLSTWAAQKIFFLSTLSAHFLVKCA